MRDSLAYPAGVLYDHGVHKQSSVRRAVGAVPERICWPVRHSCRSRYLWLSLWYTVNVRHDHWRQWVLVLWRHVRCKEKVITCTYSVGLECLCFGHIILLLYTVNCFHMMWFVLKWVLNLNQSFKRWFVDSSVDSLIWIDESDESQIDESFVWFVDLPIMTMGGL